MLGMFRSILQRKDGQGLVEYALIIALVALVIASAVGVFGTALSGAYQRIGAFVGSL
jgi:Flp pilus assembly pilin Flp